MEAGVQDVERTGPVASYHDEEAWTEERRKHLTASDIAAIFGDHPYKTAAEVQAEKLGEGNGRKVTNQMKAGLDLEPLAARLYAEKTGRRIRRMPMLVHRERPLFAASVDRQILAGDDHPTAALEIKCPTWRVASEIRRKGLRPYMVYQGQLEAEVPGYPFTAFGILDREAWEILTFDLEHEPDFCADVMDRAEEWWNRHIVNREPAEEAEPPEKLPEVPGEVTFREDEPFLEAASLLLEARDIRDEAKAAYDAAKDELKAVLGAYGVYEGGDARIYYRQQPGRTTKDWKGLEKARPFDPARVQEVLLSYPIPGFGVLDREQLLQTLGDEALLDLDAFLKTGNPYEELRPYRLKREEG